MNCVPRGIGYLDTVTCLFSVSFMEENLVRFCLYHGLPSFIGDNSTGECLVYVTPNIRCETIYSAFFSNVSNQMKPLQFENL